MIIRLKQFRRLELRHVASSNWIEHIIKAVIPCNACIVRMLLGPLIYCHVTSQHHINILVQQDVTHHQSMPTHQLMPHHQSTPRYRSTSCHQTVYVNSVVNSTMYNIVHMNSIVHVNNAIYPFMLLLGFLIVLSPKLLFVLLSDHSFIMK